MSPSQADLLALLSDGPRSREELMSALDSMNEPAAFRMLMLRLRRSLVPVGLGVSYADGVYTLHRVTAPQE